MARARAGRSPPTRAPATPGRAERAPAGAAPRTRGTAPTGRPRSSGVSAPSGRRLRCEHHEPDTTDRRPEVTGALSAESRGGLWRFAGRLLSIWDFLLIWEFRTPAVNPRPTPPSPS